MLDIYECKRVLVLAPHPDDAEFSCGGTLSILKEKGAKIYFAIFSMCEKSTPEGFEIGIIEKELDEVVLKLDLNPSNVFKYYFEVRNFPKYRQEILEELIILRNKINPDLVLLPSKNDLHQDHQTVHQEGVRAFKHYNMLGYEMPWNNFDFYANLFMPLTERDIKKKINLIKCYRSQSQRAYSSEKFIRSLALLRGVQIDQQFAESFEVIRWIHNY